MPAIDLEGRVAIVTGAGRGLGREYSLLLAAHGVRVVVNDLGVDEKGQRTESTPADDVVAEILDGGGEAISNRDDVSTWSGAKAVVRAAVTGFGDLDIAVNNAGILRDRVIVKMSEEDFDEVIRVHLKAHFALTRFAGSYWRKQHKMGVERRRNLIHTSSTSGIYANPGQSNYGPAKSGIVTFSQIAAKELDRYGVVSNCLLPGARTRLTMSSPGLPEIMSEPDEGFDQWHPANVAPLVAYLAGAGCPFSGETFYIQGGIVRRLTPWSLAGASIERSTRWDLAELADAMQTFLDPPPPG